MTKTIYKFNRDENGNPIGMVLAQKMEDGTFGVGWSKVCVKKGDKFDKDKAIMIATNRAKNGFNIGKIPYKPEGDSSILEDYLRMFSRASRYFKTQPNQGTKIAMDLYLDKEQMALNTI
jgi:hypothetical protein